MIVISDKLRFDNKKDVILIHLYIKSKEFGINVTEGMKDIIYYIYEMGGIESEKDFSELAKWCIKNSSIKTKNSVRTALSKCVMLNIVENKGKYLKVVSKEWLPEINEDFIGLDYKITNAI